MAVLLAGADRACSGRRDRGRGGAAATGALGTTGSGRSLTLTLWIIAAVGLVVAWHQPGNAIGWLMLGRAVALAADLRQRRIRRGLPGAAGHALPVLGPGALIFAQLFFFPFIAFPLIIWLFPDGRLPPGRWQWAFWIYLALSLPGFLAVLGPPSPPRPGTPSTSCPTGSSPRWRIPRRRSSAGVGALFLFGLVAGWLGALAWQIASWRRSSGERRQQLKWLMSGAAVCGVFADRLVRRRASALGNTDHRHHRAAGVDRDRDPEVPAV